MKSICSNLAVVTALTIVAFFGVIDSAAAGEGKPTGTTCACESLNPTTGFNIDCSNQADMLAAVGVLESNECDKIDCNSNEECVKNFFIIQTHHDYCFHEDVPETIEKLIHIYEETCDHCEISPKFNAEQRPCPPVDCDLESGGADEYYQSLMANPDCQNDCSPSVCANSFRYMKAVHDKCPKDTLSWTMELAYHDFDEVCDRFGCNLPEAGDPKDELICEDPEAAKSATATASSISTVASFIAVVAVSFVSLVLV